MREYLINFCIIFVLAIPFSGCASTATPDSKYGISFAQLKSVEIGGAPTLVIHKFGQPDIKEKSDRADSEYWIYRMRGFRSARVTLLIDLKKSTIETKSFTFMGEPESNLSDFLLNFPDSKFKSARRKQTGHWIPNEIDYVDSANGVYFTVSDARQKVEFVMWANPHNKELIASLMK